MIKRNKDPLPWAIYILVGGDRQRNLVSKLYGKLGYVKGYGKKQS